MINPLDNKILIGIAYPILPEIVSSLRGKKKVVFCKMAAHEVMPKRIIDGNKLFFYESQSNNSIVGESKIERIDLLSLKEICEKRIEDLFIPLDKLKDYVGGRKTKKMVVFYLIDIKFYKNPIKILKYITMTGRYIYSEEYKKWRIE